MKDYQLALPKLAKGMSKSEAVLFDRKVGEWKAKGYTALFGDEGDEVLCILYKPKTMEGQKTLHKLKEFRGHGATPLKALQSAAAENGNEALFG
jgi:hypothetical protein